jgi:hypothetical protein
MKYIKISLIAASLLAGFMVLALPTTGYATKPDPGAGLGTQAQQDCFDKWNGTSVDHVSVNPVTSTDAKWKGYKACDTSNGGNCKKVTSTEGGSANAVISCSNPAGEAGNTGGAGGDGSGSAIGACDTTDGYKGDPAVCDDSNGCSDADNCDLVSKYVNPIINKFLAPLAILAVVFGIVWGAIQYITAGGDSQKVAQAKAHIQRAITGLVAFLFLYAFLNWLLPGGLL